MDSEVGQPVEHRLWPAETEVGRAEPQAHRPEQEPGPPEPEELLVGGKTVALHRVAPTAEPTEVRRAVGPPERPGKDVVKREVKGTSTDRAPSGRPVYGPPGYEVSTMVG